MIPLSPDEPPLRPATYANPVYGGYLADPFVFFAEGYYYAVGTGPQPEGGPRREFPIMRSADLFHWEPLGGALIPKDDVSRHYWAPEVAEHNGTYYMYYSAGVSDERHELRVALSDRPEGPYIEAATPVLDPATASFAIDPSPFQDVDGTWYLFYARDFLEPDGGDRTGTALVMAPLEDMLRIPAGFSTVMRARHDWQRYQANRIIYEGVRDWHTLEGPTVVRHGDLYYCLYSGGNWQNDSYGIDFVVADSIFGPWRDTNPGVGPRVLRTVPGKVVGPGHNSVTQDLEGNPYLAYHAWDAGMTARRFCIDRLMWTEDGPQSSGPTWTPQPTG